MYDAYVKFKDTAKKFIPEPLFEVVVNGFHLSESVMANIRYGFPARSMQFVGVTGTNGKTTTSLMVATILEEAGYKVGMSSSAFIKDGGPVRLNDLPGRLTNPNPWLLQALLRQMKRNGVQWVVLECGSHALQQRRVWGVKFDAAIITNITEDHLEYHKTMENYTRAKGLLFGLSKNVGVINRDDPRADYFLSLSTPHKVTYGKDKRSDYQLRSVELKQKSTTVKLGVKGESFVLNLQLAGEFNAYNATAALAAATELGVDKQVAKTALEGMKRVPGRFDAVSGGQKFSVLVDDAHTPDAIENVLKAARAVTKGKLFIVTGSSGERGDSRRAPMGRIASTLADVCVLTDDEPHHEDPDNVLNGIKSGAVEGKAKVLTVVDRCDAMRKAFELAGPDDTIVLAGMGYKHHRDGPNGPEPWDDYQVAEDILHGKVSEFETNWRDVMHAAWPKTR